MNFLISIIVAIALVSIGRDFIRKHANLCYGITTIISIGIIVGVYSGTTSTLPDWFNTNILPYFTKSTFATALFVIVMYTGAFKNGSKLIKFLMPIRAQLSIIASILVLAHNITFGKYHFVTLFTNPSSMSLNVFLAAIVSIILIALMLPLMITSFPSVRKKMGAKKWKKLQKSAYLFYALIYIHVMLLMIPVAKTGNTDYILNVLIYSVVFLTYATMRVHKEYVKKNFSKSKTASPIIVGVLSFCLVCGYVLYNPMSSDADDSSDIASSDEISDEDISSNSDNSSNEESSDSETKEEVILNDGVYTGSASGYNGKITVEVTVLEGAIDTVNISDHSDDSPYIDNAIDNVVESILSSNSTDVDTVSGATYSSKGIINAVKVALIQAKN